MRSRLVLLAALSVAAAAIAFTGVRFRYLTPPAVERYIHQRGLYRSVG